MIEIVVIMLSSLAFLVLLYIIFSNKRTPLKQFQVKQEDRNLLCQYVSFYSKLDENKKLEFENQVQNFLSKVRITGINTDVERLDELLIAASAIIPIFNFTKWEYINLNEVLLYPATFDEMFNQEGDERTRAGVVGDGPYQNIMILSKHDLRQGFINSNSTDNTGIHEFVHLIDKTDGAVDGIPETLIGKDYVLPWLNLMQQNIQCIREERSDINPYGATNQAEFFAVVSEYFFERPDLLQENHPELFKLLTQIFRQKLVK
jgi:MtfA peptidase